MPGYGISGPTEGSGLLHWSWATERLTAARNYWPANANVPEVQDWIQTEGQYFPGFDPNTYAEGSWLAAKIFTEQARKLGSGLTRASLREQRAASPMGPAPASPGHFAIAAIAISLAVLDIAPRILGVLVPIFR